MIIIMFNTKNPVFILYEYCVKNKKVILKVYYNLPTEYSIIYSVILYKVLFNIFFGPVISMINSAQGKGIKILNVINQMGNKTSSYLSIFYCRLVDINNNILIYLLETHTKRFEWKNIYLMFCAFTYILT